MKIVVSALLGIHMLMGNLCMMPMAYAQGMPMPEETHDDAVEMMTPMVPMSPAHCEHCTKVIKQSTADSMNNGMPCSSGHCFTHATPIASTVVPSVDALVFVALPTTGIVFPPASLDYSLHPSTAPPQNVRITDTIVLRL